MLDGVDRQRRRRNRGERRTIGIAADEVVQRPDPVLASSDLGIIGSDVLQKEKAPTWLEHTRNLRQGDLLIRDAAQHQSHHRGVKRRIRERQMLCRRVDELGATLQGVNPLTKASAHVLVRLGKDQHRHRLRIVRNVQSSARTDFDGRAVRPGEELAPLLTQAGRLRSLVGRVIDRGKQSPYHRSPHSIARYFAATTPRASLGRCTSVAPSCAVDDPFEAALRALTDSPDDGDARLALAQRFSYVIPDAQSLAMLGGLGPIVEIGAGTGYWASRLIAHGVDFVAFDQAPPDGEAPNRYHAPTPTFAEVRRGDQTVLRDHPDRALFLCWPPLFSSLGDCLTYYAGNTIACIGDGGHRTARIQSLNTDFACVAVHPVHAIDPAPDAIAALSIWRRR
jgi:hypothetical protein